MAHRDGLHLDTLSTTRQSFNGGGAARREGNSQEAVGHAETQTAAAQPAANHAGFEDAAGISAPSQQHDAAVNAPDKIHRRRTSITFNPRVTHDDGKQTRVDEPVSKEKQPLKHRGRSILQEMSEGDVTRIRTRTHSESDRAKYDPITGEPVGRRRSRREAVKYTVGESRHPLLQTTVDDLAQYGDSRYEKSLQSMTSASTLSPESLPANTPSDVPEEYNLSPHVASSPIQFPNQFHSLSHFGIFSDLEQSQPARAKSYEPERSMSLRRLSKRNTARSTSSSSLSPAGAFLSQWGGDDAAAATATAAAPDDEGQEIGDHSEYIIGRQIGYGGFSVVKEAFTIENDQRVRRAVKIVRKVVQGKSEHENDKLQNEFEHEVSIWRFLKHPYILPLITVFDSPFATFCITQLNTGGTLFDLVRSHRRRAHSTQSLSALVSERERQKQDTEVQERQGIPLKTAKRYIYQLASALRYLHRDMRIVHRDIKLENCLLNADSSVMAEPSPSSASSMADASEASDGNVLLCDFGMADFISREDRDDSSNGDHSPSDDGQDNSSDVAMAPLDAASDAGSDVSVSHLIGPSATSTSVAGSLPYAAPELIRTSRPLYAPSVDMWAFGVVVFALLTAELPFQHSFAPKLTMMILKGEWSVALIEAALRQGQGRRGAGPRGHGAAGRDADGGAAPALELLRGCLHMDPRRRWDVARVLDCAFLRGCAELYEPQM